MKVKTFVAAMGLSMAAGAAAIMMMPKSSKVYRAAEDATQAIKMEAGRMMDSMSRK